MKTNDLETKPVLGVVLRLAIPAMLAQFINVLYSIIDRLFISNLEGIGDLALSGVGITAPFCTFITSFSILIGLGGAPLVAMSLGEGRSDNARKILFNSFIAMLGLGILIPLIIYIFHEPLIYLFGATDNTFIYARDYLLYYLIGAPCALMTLGLNQFLISQGYSTKAMITMLIGAITNIALDPIFIFTLGLGVKGGAIATSISQIISFIYVLIMLLKYSNVKLRVAPFDFRLILKISKLGFSPFIIMMTDSLVFIILNMSIKMHGGDLVDKYINVATISTSFYQLFSMPLMGISGGTGSILSYNYGARNSKRVKRAAATIASVGLVFTTLSFIISMVSSRTFIGFYTSDEFIIKESASMIFMFMITFIPLAFEYCFVDGLTALGRAKHAISISLTRKLSLMGLIVAMPFIFGIRGIYIAQPIADILSSIIAILVFTLSLGKILKRREESTTTVV